MTDFCHLHVNSEYTLLDGACRADALPAAAATLGQRALALTDIGTLSGCPAFFRACIAAGIKPIIGCELSFSVFEGASGRLVLLCENSNGYSNLVSLVSEASAVDGILPAERLRGRTEGLIALCGATEGEVFSHLSAGDYPRAVETARKYGSLFGRENFFIELENHLTPAETGMLPLLARVASTAGLRCVASNRVKFISAADSATRDALTAVKEGRRLGELPPSSPEYRLKSGDEMAELFRDYPQALEETALIADRCSFEYDTSARHLPKFPLPAGTCAEERLLSVAASGLDRLVASGSVPAAGHKVDEYADRLARELEVIASMGFCDYFLIVADYVAAARRAGIRVGPGRGSACGSLVAFCAGITEVDPVGYGLYFERFLNPDRVSMPDIDIDFDSARRDEVIEYVRNKYGASRVAHIVSYGTFAPKAALRDAFRVCGVPSDLADRAVSLLPADAEGLAGMMKDGRLDSILSLGREVGEAVAVAARIEGFPRNLSVHAAGIVITDGGESAGGEIPTFTSGGESVTQYDMDDIAKLGFLKFDFLALRYLTVIDEAEKSAKKEIPGFDPDGSDLSDPDAYRILSSGYTLGIFQLEKGGITSLVKRMRPECLEDLVAAIALYRPGPVDSIPKYLEGRRDPERIVYPHPLLRGVLEPTFGCVVYQEQVISIFRVLAGYTAGRADLVRRAMSKKDRGALENEKGEFVRGAAEKGMEETAAADLFDSLVSFSGYAFNRSHAVAYGMITYRTAFLKAKAPAHYYAALLGSWGADRIGEITAEASRLGVTLNPPDVNLSEAGFSASGKEIRFGLAGVRGCGQRLAEEIVSERGNGAFESLADFIARMPSHDLPRQAALSLIMSGAFDFTGETRASLCKKLERELENNRGGSGQLDIFSSPEDNPPAEEEVPEFSCDLLEKGEREACGIVFSGKPRSVETPAGGSRDSGLSAQEQKREDGAEASAVPEKREAEELPAVDRDSVVFVRVPSRDSVEYRKCDNLAKIFDGRLPLVFFFSDTREYCPADAGVDGQKSLLEALTEAAGPGSVALRKRKKST